MTGDAGARRRAVIAAVAATALVAAVLGGILLFGGISHPAFPKLVDAPDADVEGLVAFTRYDDQTCVFVVRAGGGTPRQIRCSEGSGRSRWTDDGQLAVDDHRLNTLLILDPADGTVVREEPLDTQPPEEYEEPRERDDGTRATLTGPDGTPRLTVVPPDGPERVVLEVDGPRNYAFVDVLWSPDGRWLLVTDSASRLLVVDAETGGARLLAEDANAPAWCGTPCADP